MKLMKQTRRLSTLVAAFIATFALAPLHAADAISPDKQVQQVTQDIIATLEANKDELSSNPQKVLAIVDEKILPHFDFGYMSQLVLGRHWRSASSEQKSNFTTEFRRLLVKTYSNALADFSGQDVEFAPYRGKPGAEDATVSMEILPKAGPSIPLDYSLYLKDDAWKVYDVNIDGLSLVTNYRRTFSADIKNDGLDALIQQLRDKNNRD